MLPRPSRSWCGRGITAAVLAVSIAALRGAEPPEGAIRDDFESPRSVWHQEETDATIRLTAHDRSKRAAHSGVFSERFQFEAGPGSAFYYSYALPKIPVTPDLHAALFVRSNRGGAQLFARVVLPADTDPETKQPSFVLVPGPIYENSDRWQKVELIDLRQSVERQARVLRASTKRPVPLDGAYLDRLVMNLYGGQGGSEVFLDDLVVEPVPAALVAAHRAPPLPPSSTPDPTRARPSAPEATRGANIQFDRNRLKHDNFDWVFSAIHAPGADIAKLRRAGFDVLAEESDADHRRLQDAVAKGFLLMPILGARESHDANQALATVQGYPFRESVAFWHLGDHLGRSRDVKTREAELARVRETVTGLHKLPGSGSRLTTGTLDGEILAYARPPGNLDIMGIRPSPWASSQQPFDTYQYLEQRRALGARWNAGGLYWAWIPAVAPRSVQTAIWGERVVPPAWGVPRVQPEQLRMYTYLALAAGYRGLAFQADAELTRDANQALLIEMALLNEELDLFESIVANGVDPIPMYDTHPPDPPAIPPPGSMMVNQRVKPKPETPALGHIRAAGIGTLDRKGILLLGMSVAGESQYQPPQMAEKAVEVDVIVPEGAQACEINPGGITWLKRTRVPGGTRITIPDFACTSLVLITTDVTLVEQIEANVNRVRPKAVALAIEQAEAQLVWVRDINDRLVALGHPIKFRYAERKSPGYVENATKIDEEAELLKRAEELIKDAKAARDREDYLPAWIEARRATRPLRVFMKAHWDQAFAAFAEYAAPEMVEERLAREAGVSADDIKKRRKLRIPTVIVPGSSPALASFNTLPQHYQLLDWLKDKSFGANLVPSGSFDDPEAVEEAGWTNHSHQYVGITSKVATDAKGADNKRPALHMTVSPANKKELDNLPPFLDFPAASIRSPAIPVTAEYLYKISVLFKRPLPGPAGVGGVIVQDSIGGEPLQYRTAAPVPDWTRVVLFRRAPASGEMTVTLGLSGFGDVFFDDFKVERIEEPSQTKPANLAARPRRRNPAAATATLPRPDGRSER